MIGSVHHVAKKQNIYLDSDNANKDKNDNYGKCMNKVEDENKQDIEFTNSYCLHQNENSKMLAADTTTRTKEVVIVISFYSSTCGYNSKRSRNSSRSENKERYQHLNDC